MHLATLITNTDFSDFSRARPDDGEKFDAMIRSARPDWRTTPFWVCKDEFPSDINAFDGVMITGSPASVNDGAPWMAQLEVLVQEIIAARIPLFAACFGHQMVAKALGRSIIRNPNGWAHGRISFERETRAPWSGEAPAVSLYGSHIEQVDRAPDGTTVLFSTPACPVTGFALGDTVFTIQHHPEMTQEFISDLVEEYADYVGPEVTETARSSLSAPADGAEFSQEIARFFEHAARAA